MFAPQPIASHSKARNAAISRPPDHAAAYLRRPRSGAPGQAAAHDFSTVAATAAGRERHKPIELRPAPQGVIQGKGIARVAGDPLEHEADRVAEQVMRMPEPAGPALAASPRSIPGRGGALPGTAPDVLRDPGRPLDPATSSLMSQHFGRDLSDVRIHVGDRASAAAQAIGAQAFTLGQHIVFGAGRYAPGAHEGMRLIVHELVHTVQQSRAGTADTADAGIPIQAGQPAVIAQQPELVDHHTVAGSAASVSWIDAASPAGSGKLGVPDPRPPATITEGFVTGSDSFRFSNYLHASVDTVDGKHVSDGAFLPNSGLYRAPSKFGIGSHAFAPERTTERFTEAGVEGISFQQVTGARTVSPAVAGAAVGTGVGIAGGIWLGAKGGAALGTVLEPGGGTVLGGILGGVAGGIAGYAGGSAVANAAFNFPPIWTRTTLRLRADGQRQCQLVQHSLFPSNSFYCDLTRIAEYSALAPQQTAWQSAGWGAGNPWGLDRPRVGVGP